MWYNPYYKNKQKRHSFFDTVIGVVMLIVIACIYTYSDFSAYSNNLNVKNAGSINVEKNVKGACVVLDAGHGADDPGKIGRSNVLEKNINLSIVIKIKRILETKGIKVILTRSSDAPLYEKGAFNKKMSDMHARINIIEKAAPDLVVSIHQNSYHEEAVYGPQVFYYKESKEGKKAAEYIQASFDNIKEIENRREAKPNDNYYLILHTSEPMVIAECGFLSNSREEALLKEESYQENIAAAISKGICDYFCNVKK